jgi:Spy/CpxP family protein refolding chaperone
MKPSWLGRVLAVVLLGAGTQALAQSGFPWWKDQKVARELGLTQDQSTRIDAIYRGTQPKLRYDKAELDQQEAELSRLIAENADETQVGWQVDRVEAVRASLNKVRTLMLLRMRQVLTPEQRAKFNALHEQWLRSLPRSSHPGSGKDRKGSR